MRFISWNTNGLRACLTKGFLDFFQNIDADFFSLQETKLQPEQISLELPGYHQYWNSAEKKGYSGTAVFTKHEPLNVTYGINIDEHDREGRVITLEMPEFFLVNVYTPNSKEELARLDYRMKWEDDFRAYLLRLNEQKPVILCGDLNVAHTEIDLKNPKTNRRNAGFTDEEREKLSTLLANGFIDSYRYLHPDTAGSAHPGGHTASKPAKKTPDGASDYFLISERLKNNLTRAEILTDIYGSDHCPVLLELNI